MSSPPPPVRRLFDAGGPTLSEVGEAELLRRLTALALASAAGPPLVVASGDDAAVWLPPAGDGIVLSQDAIVEGEDFLKSWTDPEAVDRRALAVALSDLAAMGAVPHLCMVTYCAPGDAPIDDLLAIQRGLCAAAAAAGCQVAGGDVSAISGPLVIDVAVVGTVAPTGALRRDRGHPTDALLVTGSLGEARRASPAPRGVGGRRRGRRALPRASARTAGPAGRGSGPAGVGVERARDLSDGLIVDLGRITEASGCAAEIWLDSLPTSPDVRALLGAAWPGAALGGGEDFELVAAVAADRLEGTPGGLAPGAPAAPRGGPAGHGLGRGPARPAGRRAGAAPGGRLAAFPPAVNGDELRLTTASVEATEALAARLSAGLRPGDLVALDGPLGAGKTVFVRGLAAGLGVDATVVKSPTFVLHHVYGSPPRLHHLDLYRLGPGARIELLDLDTLLESAPAAVEWAGCADLEPWHPLGLVIEIAGDQVRSIAARDPERAPAG